MKTHLLVIDGQNDFCSPKGSLYVKGAEGDMSRLSTLIKNNIHTISSIHATLDTHHKLDIAHPIFWKDQKGKHPDPGTIISADDVKTGVWKPYYPQFNDYALDYVTKLRDGDRYSLCIWPEHCLIGSWGTQLYDELYEAFAEWESSKKGMINFVTKGSNFKTEHYSAIEAEVPDPADPSTTINTQVLDLLATADRIAVAGEASSHCVYFTVKSIIDNIGAEHLSKLYILEDCMSAVELPGLSFKDKETEFFKLVKDNGGQVIKSTDLFNV